MTLTPASSWGLPAGRAGEGEAEGMQEEGMNEEAGVAALIKHEWKVGRQLSGGNIKRGIQTQGQRDQGRREDLWRDGGRGTYKQGECRIWDGDNIMRSPLISDGVREGRHIYKGDGEEEIRCLLMTEGMKGREIYCKDDGEEEIRWRLMIEGMKGREIYIQGVMERRK